MLLALGAFAATTGTSFAVIEPPGGSNAYDPGVLDQKNLFEFKQYEQRVRQENRHVDKNDIIMDRKVYDELDKLPNRQLRFILNSVTFKGNTVLTEDQLLRIVCDSIETEVSLDDLIKFANLITETYHQLGYISSLAYVPPQKIEDGNVEIIIIEGRYGNIDLEGNKWARTRFVKGRFLDDQDIVHDNILNIRDIQRSLGELNSQSYMKGQVTLQDNEESAEYTDVIYSVKDRFPLDLDLRFDNQGHSRIGLNRFVIFAGMYNLTGFGDQLVSTTSIARRSIGQGVFYSVPLTYKKETKLNLGYSYSGTRLGDIEGIRGIRGTSNNFFGGLSRRLVRTENYKLYGDISLDVRNTKTLADNVSGDLYGYKTRMIRTNLSSIKDDYYGKWYSTAGASVGVPWFDASDDNKNLRGRYPDGSSGAVSPSNAAAKFNASLVRLQALPLRSLGIFQVGGQAATRNLWPSEKMQVGGISTVRGYQEVFAMGDYGMTGSAEFRFPVPFLGMIAGERFKFIDDSIRLAAFYDWGWFGDRYVKDTSNYMMSVGAGTVLKLTKYVSGNAYIGIPIGKKYDNGSSCRVHFQITSNIL